LLRQPLPLVDTPNINLLWARLMIEELCRLGASTFCIAPGMPQTLINLFTPRARIVPCIDERSLAFWALGYGQATGEPAVVITSSGTAVANLLPAVVEASHSGVPLLLLTADRPGELRDTGANQTIDQARPCHPCCVMCAQVKIFGGYTRWAADVPAPDAAMPARMALTTVDAAYRHATGDGPGPVHLNLQFREPLAPSQTPWPSSALQACSPLAQGLERWEGSGQPFTAPVVLAGAQRGLLVVAQMGHPEDCLAALKIARSLGWPVVADVLSGAPAVSCSGTALDFAGTSFDSQHKVLMLLKCTSLACRCAVNAGLRVGASGRSDVALVHHFDHLLLDKDALWPALRPDVVLQLGGRLVSKRAAQFLEWAAQPCLEEGRPAAKWMFAADAAQRHDASHLLSHHIQMPLPALATLAYWKALLQVQSAEKGTDVTLDDIHVESAVGGCMDRSGGYSELVRTLDGCAAAEINAALEELQPLTEPHVARELSKVLPTGTGLFLGNSMPIRDMDMYAAPSDRQDNPSQQGSVTSSGIGAAVAANRGASGIDGVMSAAAGFAYGLSRGATLVVGDISFLHDVNGLNLLRTGEMRPPLTVVLINNAGGGIFSFLPIADQLPPDTFSQLWATPQNVDLAGMCRAHGIAHQRVTERVDLRKALQAAWALNKHSVVEVITKRDSNVGHHRSIQERVRQSLLRALRTVSAPAGALHMPLPTHSCAFGISKSNLITLEHFYPSGSLLAKELRVTAASYRRYGLPLLKPLTTDFDRKLRGGFLLQISVESDNGVHFTGIGEIAPLPGAASS
ncbi:Thiamin diphosphate-binding protein, partial [Coccomyxa subellipsoidea C-169]